jgi:hypothetical protein
VQQGFDTQRVTWLVVLFSIVILATEQPVGDLELGGFPVGYYWTAILLSTAFWLRRELNGNRRKREAEASTTVSYARLIRTLGADEEARTVP